eukprot:524696_1
MEVNENELLLQLLKEKSNIFNAKCQRLQINIKLMMDNITKSNVNPETASIIVNRICAEYLSSINQLETEYLTKCEKYLPIVNINNVKCKNNSTKCTVCNKIYSTKKLLNEHMINTHNINPWKCSQCNDTFKNKMELNIHWTSTHSSISNPMPLKQSSKCIYTEFSLSEKKELSTIRFLLTQLLHSVPELYSMENISNRLHLNSELFVNWLYNTDEQPLIRSDSHESPISLLQTKSVSIHSLRETIHKIKLELNNLSTNTELYDNNTLTKVKKLMVQFEKIDVESQHNTNIKYDYMCSSNEETEDNDLVNNESKSSICSTCLKYSDKCICQSRSQFVHSNVSNVTRTRKLFNHRL